MATETKKSSAARGNQRIINCSVIAGFLLLLLGFYFFWKSVTPIPPDTFVDANGWMLATIAAMTISVICFGIVIITAEKMKSESLMQELELESLREQVITANIRITG